MSRWTMLIIDQTPCILFIFAIKFIHCDDAINGRNPYVIYDSVALLVKDQFICDVL